MRCYNITEIEDTFKALLGSVTSLGKVYNDRPKAEEKTNDFFTVVKCIGGLDDEHTYATTTLYVALFAKDLSHIKNSKKLGVMQKALFNAMPAERENILIDQHPDVLPDVADDYGYHARIINFSILIKICQQQ